MATREEQMELSTVERNYEGGLRLSEDVAKEFASGPKYVSPPVFTGKLYSD